MRHFAKPIAALCALLALANCSEANEPVASRAGNDLNAGVERVVSEGDRACLAEAIYFEAGGTAEARAAVAHVVLNRSRDPRFPGSVCGVVKDGCQFSYRCSGRSLALQDPTKREGAVRSAEAVLTGAPDITNGALFFHAASAEVGWFASRKRVGEIGGNVFYR